LLCIIFQILTGSPANVDINLPAWTGARLNASTIFKQLTIWQHLYPACAKVEISLPELEQG